MKINKENRKGSVLVFTLFVMILTLIAGLSLIAVSLAGRRSTIASSKSVNAFQIADSGLEAALVEIKNISVGSDPSINSIFNCNGNNEFADNNISSGEYVVTFWDDATPDPNQLDCGSNNISDIKKVKSVGTYKNTTRSVETTFATP